MKLSTRYRNAAKILALFKARDADERELNPAGYHPWSLYFVHSELATCCCGALRKQSTADDSAAEPIRILAAWYMPDSKDEGDFWWKDPELNDEKALLARQLALLFLAEIAEDRGF